MVTLLGMVTEVRPVQSRKAPTPIEVTLLGMVTEVRLVQPQKAYCLISITPFGITRFVTSEPLIVKLCEQYKGLAE